MLGEDEGVTDVSAEGIGGRAHELNLLSEHPTKLGRIC